MRILNFKKTAVTGAKKGNAAKKIEYLQKNFLISQAATLGNLIYPVERIFL